MAARALDVREPDPSPRLHRFGVSLLRDVATLAAAAAVALVVALLLYQPVVSGFTVTEQQAVIRRMVGVYERAPILAERLAAISPFSRALAHLAARRVTVHELELLERAGDVLHLRIRCSKGTYVRQLAVDLGLALGTLAHLEALCRTRVAGFRLDQAVTLEDLQALGEEARLAWLLPPDSLLEDLPRTDLPEELEGRFLNGQVVAQAAACQGPCRVYGKAGVLLGVGEGGPGDELRPARLIARV